MKRLLALCLAIAMLSAQTMPIMAADQKNNGSASTSANAEQKASGSGNIELAFQLESPLENGGADRNIKVKLSGGTQADKVLSIADAKAFDAYGEPASGADIKRQVFAFQGLTPDVYTLTVSGTGMKSYTQSVQVTNDSVSKLIIDNLSQLQMGDVDGDGTLSMGDRDRIIKAMDFVNVVVDPATDLNGDGKTNILDLSYFHNSSKNKQTTAAVSNLGAALEGGTTVAEGSVLNLLQKGETETVKLAPENPGQSISETNAVTIALDVSGVQASGIHIALPETSDAPTSGTVEVEFADGSKELTSFTSASGRSGRSAMAFFSQRSQSVEVKNNAIQIDLGAQKAVKRVTIKVTGTADNTNLAEISKVEFIGDMADRVPPPQMNIPSPLKAESANKSFVLSWPAQTNVTGYEVRFSTKNTPEAFTTAGQFESILCGENTAKVSRYANDDLKNGTTYYAVVQSVNGKWSSGFSEIVSVVPKATTPPDAPGSVTIVPGYRELNVSWAAPEDADGYNIYYKKSGTTDFQLAGKSESTNYRLTGLEDKTKYVLYITAYNDMGTSGRSSEVSGETTDLVPPVTTNYKLLNTSNGVGKPTAHIKDVKVSGYAANTYPNGFDPFFVVDNNYTSHWTDKVGNTNNGPTVTFDQPYAMSKVIFSTRLESGFMDLFSSASITVWESETAQPKTIPEDQIKWKSIKSGTFEVEFPVQTAQKIQVKFHRYYGGVVSMSEMKFYHYDSLEDDVNALFSDALHIKLRPDVTLATIEALEARANTADAVSGEYHPKREALLRELKRAKDLLEDTAASDVIVVDQKVSNNRNGHLGFSYNLNDWQPLGITAKEGEELSVYVGKTGNTLPKLVVSQHYPEYTHLMKEFDLKEGKNTITVPRLGSIDTERGGSVYVRYPNANVSGEIQVRVSGGSKIPVLDIHGMTDPAAIRDKINAYAIELQAHVANLQTNHAAIHETESYSYSYNERHCILNNTEIVLNDVMLTIPATQALASIGGTGATAESLTARLYDGTLAINEMMDLFYKEKGLVPYGTAGREKDWRPSSRVNMRYTRMLNGAFMYAAGWHMGIEYNSSQLLGGKPINIVDGKPEGYNDAFGWGIAHEVGHIIDQQGMVWGEVTNNLFPLFLQTRDDIGKSRIESSANGYAGIYKKVTSGQKGKTTDGFTAMGMYWQLHLAFDDQPTWDNTVDDTFYAKLSRLYRRGEGTAASGQDDRLIRLASDASGYDLREYFERWGLFASSSTDSYLDGKYPSPGAIYYLNDAARRYRIGAGAPMDSGTAVVADITNSAGSKQVNFTLGVSGDSDPILGYEILRNGVPVGFAEAAETGSTYYTDVISSANNTVFTYEVIAYDYLLNKTQKSDAVSLKISHDGSLDKRNWKASTNTAVIPNGQEDDPCGLNNPAINKVIDDSMSTSFTGTTTSGDGYIILDMNGIQPAVGLKYSGSGIGRYEIAVSKDSKDWTTVRTGSFSGTQTVYFAEQGGDLTVDPAHPWVYQSGYVKLTAKGSRTISAAEIDVIAPPGDNVGFLDSGFVGTLAKEFVYGDQPEDRIPAGAVVVTGNYRGNPAYNTVLLKDENDNTLNGEQVIFAEVPDGSDILDVNEGTWVFWVTDGESALTSKIKAQLYRTDNAFTNDGQRMVSDTLYAAIPSGGLPSIELSGGKPAAPPNEPPASSVPQDETLPEDDEPSSVPEDSESTPTPENSEASSIPDSSESSAAPEGVPVSVTINSPASLWRGNVWGTRRNQNWIDSVKHRQEAI